MPQACDVHASYSAMPVHALGDSRKASTRKQRPSMRSIGERIELLASLAGTPPDAGAPPMGLPPKLGTPPEAGSPLKPPNPPNPPNPASPKPPEPGLPPVDDLPPALARRPPDADAGEPLAPPDAVFSTPASGALGKSYAPVRAPHAIKKTPKISESRKKRRIEIAFAENPRRRSVAERAKR
jgi:hypothetical protein